MNNNNRRKMKLYLSSVRLSFNSSFHSYRHLYHSQAQTQYAPSMRYMWMYIVQYISWTRASAFVYFVWFINGFCTISKNLCHRMFWMNEWVLRERQTRTLTISLIRIIHEHKDRWEWNMVQVRKYANYFDWQKNEMKWNEMMCMCVCLIRKNSKWWRLWSIIVCMPVISFLWVPMIWGVPIPVLVFSRLRRCHITHSIHWNQFILSFTALMMAFTFFFRSSAHVNLATVPHLIAHS